MNYNFTKKDIETMKELSAGCTYKEIARKQNISPHTVVWRVQRIMKATNCRNKAQLINYFYLNFYPKSLAKQSVINRFWKLIAIRVKNFFNI